MRHTSAKSGAEESNYFTETCSGSEAGSYIRLKDFVYHSTLGLRVIQRHTSAKSGAEESLVSPKHGNQIHRDFVFKAHRLLYHSTLGLRVIKKRGRRPIRSWNLRLPNMLPPDSRQTQPMGSPQGTHTTRLDAGQSGSGGPHEDAFKRENHPHSVSYVFLSSLELIDTKVYAP